MYTDKLLKSLLLFILTVFVIVFGSICILNLTVGESSFFNYLKKKNESIMLEKKLNKKLEERKNLLNEVNILKNSNVINLDILEKETIKKLNRIPSGYKIIITD